MDMTGDISISDAALVIAISANPSFALEAGKPVIALRLGDSHDGETPCWHTPEMILPPYIAGRLVSMVAKSVRYLPPDAGAEFMAGVHGLEPPS